MASVFALQAAAAQAVAQYEYALQKPFVWEEATPYYAPGTVQGDPATCCGSAIVGNPEYQDSEQYTCVCDLTTGSCDDGCCCDPDCSGVLSLQVFQCATNASVILERRVRQCSDQLESINLPSTAESAGYSTLELDGLLCVVTDNSISNGEFLKDPVEKSALTTEEIAQEIVTISPTTFDTWLAPPSASLQQGSFYTLDRPVLGDACTAPGSDLGCDNLVELMVPAVAADGSCDSEQQVPFLRDAGPFECTLASPLAPFDLAEACSYGLNASFLETMSIASAPLSVATRRNATLMLANTSAAPYELVDHVGHPRSNQKAAHGGCPAGLLSAALCCSLLLSAAPLCSSAAPLLPPSRALRSPMRQVPHSLNHLGGCASAMVSYQLRLVVNGGVIESVTAYVRLDDIPDSANASAIQ
eukprot:5909847-Prymnesium_polylepis.1